MKKIARLLAIGLLASSAACVASNDTDEPQASTESKLEEDALCMDDVSGDGSSSDAGLALSGGGSLPLGSASAGGDAGAIVVTPAGALPLGPPRTGSLPSLTLDLGTIQLPRQFIGSIVLDPVATCSLTASIGYVATPAPNNQWSVSITATVTGTCYVTVDGQRYGIIHPTIHGSTTITAMLSGSATITSGLDCATVRNFTPAVSVTLAGRVSYTDPIFDVYGRCGRRRPILSIIATNQARQAAAQAAAQVQQLINDKLGAWQTATNAWLATQVPQIAALICGANPAVTPVSTVTVVRTPPTSSR